jgi:hypothetical protein
VKCVFEGEVSLEVQKDAKKERLGEIVEVQQF